MTSNSRRVLLGNAPRLACLAFWRFWGNGVHPGRLNGGFKSRGRNVGCIPRYHGISSGASLHRPSPSAPRLRGISPICSSRSFRCETILARHLSPLPRRPAAEHFLHVDHRQLPKAHGCLPSASCAVVGSQPTWTLGRLALSPRQASEKLLHDPGGRVAP